MPPEKLAGGPTQDEIMAVSLRKLGLRNTDAVLEIGCGTGKVSVALAESVKSVASLDIRPGPLPLQRRLQRKPAYATSRFPVQRQRHSCPAIQCMTVRLSAGQRTCL